jgi:hypothetical protein
MAIEEREQTLSEIDRLLLRLYFRTGDRADHSHKRSIASIHSNRVYNKIALGPVLAGDYTTVGFDTSRAPT